MASCFSLIMPSMTTNIEALLTLFADQPPWSDIPAVLLCHPGHGAGSAHHIIASLRNVTVLERPTTIRTLISSLKAALQGAGTPISDARAVQQPASSQMALKSASEALHDTNRRKDEFLAMLAHELRNPLAPIRTASEVLARKLPDPQLQKIVSLVKRQVTHLTGWSMTCWTCRASPRAGSTCDGAGGPGGRDRPGTGNHRAHGARQRPHLLSAPGRRSSTSMATTRAWYKALPTF